jgi:xanthine dehydrogenase YagS FAD-binding subunit
LRLNVVRPGLLVDINSLPLNQIEDLPDGGLRIGALARMSDVAEAPGVVERFPVIAQALVLGASPQLRNMASMGGTMLQRVRCRYFRDARSACNKREPGSGYAALEGINRGHVILGTSEHYIATNPSDVAVALVAIVHTQGPSGERAIPIDDFFLLPGDTLHIEHPLEHGELIVAIEVPAATVARRSLYLKVRDRESYEFALASVAVALRVDDAVIGEARLALGSVAPSPDGRRRYEECVPTAGGQGGSLRRACGRRRCLVQPPRGHKAR